MIEQKKNTVTSENKQETFSLGYGIFCLLLISITSISNTWSRSIISAMFGYGVRGYNDGYYTMIHEVTEFTPETYGNYVGFYYSVTFVPALLFVGHLTQSWNRKLMIGISCFVWGLASYLHSYATSMTQFYILRMIVGFSSSISGPATYSLITDFFEKKYRIKAFFFY